MFTAYTSIHHADTGIFHKLRDTFRCKIRHFTPILSVFYRTTSKRYNFAFYTTERSFQFSIINYLSVTIYLFLCVAEDKFLPRTIFVNISWRSMHVPAITFNRNMHRVLRLKLQILRAAHCWSNASGTKVHHEIQNCMKQIVIIIRSFKTSCAQC